MPQSVRRLRFPIDHIVARQHGGQSVSENLALCCGHCNRHKGPNVAGIDSETGEIVRLFHPRLDHWADHFRWEGVRIAGVTAEGRVTVAILQMNHDDQLAVRGELAALGRFLQ
jgi:hypothetical protein